MRQSIVLLITLFFITAISILILQNLKDTDEFLNKVSYDSALSQTIISMDNIKQEIPKYLQKYKGNIDEILKNSQAIPLQFGNVDILLNIQEYELPQFNINELNSSMKSNEDFVNNINYKYDFLQLVNKNKPYSSNNQIEQTINEYIKY